MNRVKIPSFLLKISTGQIWLKETKKPKTQSAHGMALQVRLSTEMLPGNVPEDSFEDWTLSDRMKQF